jgi:hypothetical protein
LREDPTTHREPDEPRHGTRRLLSPHSAHGAVLRARSTGAQARDKDGKHTLFIKSAIELPGDIASMRKHGSEDRRGNPITFVIFDTPDGKGAARLGANGKGTSPASATVPSGRSTPS